MEHAFKPPLSDELLLSSDFFVDLYPLDGGGALVTPEIITCLGDEEFARQILEEDALRDFGQLPQLDHHRFERWRFAQKSCWLNRFYWLVPLAKQQAITSDKSLARLLVDAMLHFIDSCAGPSGEEQIRALAREVYHLRDHVYNQMSYDEIQQDEMDIRYIWFDFEPASRLLHWIHALHFLRLGGGIGAEDERRIVASLYQHAEVIYYVEKHDRALRKADNHQCLRGVALLYAGTFFRGHKLSDEFLAQGVKIIEYQSEHSFSGDGSLKEISPSYHAFQTWHMRDARLLSEQYGFDLDTELSRRLANHVAYIQGVSDPGGQTVVINDSYPVPTERFVRSFDQVVEPGRKTETCYFPDAGLAALTRDGLFVLLDASPFTGKASHYHAGKNALTLWMGGVPMLVDSGCCPYDDEAYTSWYRLGKAHCSLLVNGQGDGQLRSLYDFTTLAATRCTAWREEVGKQCVSGISTGTAGPWEQVVWERAIEIDPASLVTVRDTVSCQESKTLEFVFNLHPDTRATVSGRRIVLHHASTQVHMDLTCSNSLDVTLRPGRYYSNAKHHLTQQIVVSIQGKANVELQSTFLLA